MGAELYSEAPVLRPCANSDPAMEFEGSGQPSANFGHRAGGSDAPMLAHITQAPQMVTQIEIARL